MIAEGEEAVERLARFTHNVRLRLRAGEAADDIARDLAATHDVSVSDATADLYGGRARFDYRMENLGQPGVRGTAIFDAAYEDVDLTAFSNMLELRGIRLAGRASGRNLLQWPLGDYAEHTGEGEIAIAPPPGVETITRELPAARIDAGALAAPLPRRSP